MATTGNHPTFDATRQDKATRGPALRLLHPILLFLASISAATGCTAMSDADTSTELFRDQQSTADAKAQIGRWIVPEMAIADAMQTLGSRGFSCKPVEPTSGEVRSSILCLYSTPPSPPPDQRMTAPRVPINWFVTLNSKDGALITDFQVARTPKEIGG